VTFQVLTAVTVEFRIVFWDVLQCKIIVNRRFRGMCCLHHQGWFYKAVHPRRQFWISLIHLPEHLTDPQTQFEVLPMIKYGPSNAGGSDSTAPYILNVSSTHRCVVSFMPLVLIREEAGWAIHILPGQWRIRPRRAQQIYIHFVLISQLTHMTLTFLMRESSWGSETFEDTSNI
jgi:hypothetical protein